MSKPSSKGLAAIFKRFAGKEVEVIEKKREHRGHEYTVYSIAENDKTIKGIQALAKENGLSLRVWLPGDFGDMRLHGDRMNVNVEKAADGKWRVGGFRMG